MPSYRVGLVETVTRRLTVMVDGPEISQDFLNRYVLPDVGFVDSPIDVLIAKAEKLAEEGDALVDDHFPQSRTVKAADIQRLPEEV